MRAIALVALTGCTQVFGLTDPVKQMPADAAPDTAMTMRDAPIDGLPPGACDPTQNDLLACFDFEGSVVDRSPSGHVVTTVANVLFSGNGGPDGVFASLTSTSAITIAASTAFNTDEYTITAWVRLDALPSGPAARVGVFDSEERYGLFIDAAGNLVVRGVSSAQPLISSAQWTHLAVTDDGQTVVFYVNGTAAASATANTSVPSSNLGSEIGGNAPTGDRMTGQIDKLRVFRRVLSAAEVSDQH